MVVHLNILNNCFFKKQIVTMVPIISDFRQTQLDTGLGWQGKQSIKHFSFPLTVRMKKLLEVLRQYINLSQVKNMWGGQKAALGQEYYKLLQQVGFSNFN
jgi:hypothetical protein